MATSNIASGLSINKTGNVVPKTPTTPIASMGTVARDPAKNVSAPSTILPASQIANPNIASGISIWGPSTITVPGGAPKNPTPPSAANAKTADLLMGAMPKSLPKPVATIGTTAGSTPPTPQPVVPQTPSITPPVTTPPATDPTTTPAAPVPSPYVAPAAQATTPSTGLYGQLINQQAERSKGSPEYTAAATAYQKAVTDRNALKQQMDNKLAEVDLEPIPLEFQQGRKQVLNQLFAQKLADADAAVTQAQQGMSFATGQYGAETSALQGALGSAGTVLSGGQYQPFGGDNSNLTTGIAKATQWAIAQQNMAQGANYQGQAQELSNALQTMQPLGQKLTEFMTQSGLNPADAPVINEQIKTIDAQAHPAAVATMNAAINDIRSYAIQILGSQSGANPTDVTAAVSSFDFGNFTPLQLQTLFKNLENMGMTRLAQAQSASQAGYNANLKGGGAAAQGATAQDLGPFGSDKSPSGTTENVLKGLGGAVLNVPGDIGGLAKYILE